MRERRRFVFPSLILSLAVCIALPAAAQTNVGVVKVGSSANSTVTVTVNTAGTLGSISVRTMGAEGLDYTNASGGTCATGTEYAMKSFCTVKMAFAPRFTGARYGAVVLLDGNGNVMGTQYVQGSGQGPQATILAGTATELPIQAPPESALAVDADGNLFAAAPSSEGIVEESPTSGGYQQTSISKYDDLDGIAIDGAGNLFTNLEDSSSARFVRNGENSFSALQSLPSVSGADFLGSVAVDGSGNLYTEIEVCGSGIIEDAYSNGTYVASALPVLEQLCGDVIPQGTGSPYDLAVDSAGSLYFGFPLLNDPYTGQLTVESQVLKLSPRQGGTYGQTNIALQLKLPYGPVVDGDQNLFISDLKEANVYVGTNALYLGAMQSDGSYVRTTVANSHQGPLALDANNNLYTDGGQYVINLANPAPLGFPNTGISQSSAAQVVNVVNTGNQPLSISAVSFPTDFPEQSNAKGDCAAGAALAVGASCTLTIDFAPTASLNGGTTQALSENVTITSNTLNAPGTVQAIPVTGTETLPVPPTTLTTSADPSPVSNTVTFTATVATVGSNGTPTGSVNFYTSGTSLGNIPLTGNTAAYSTSALAAGTYSVNAQYGGNTTYSASSSNAIVEVVGPAAPKFTLTSSSNPAQEGTAVTFTAAVTGVSGGTAPTGEVTFYNGTATLGAVPLSGGKAQYSTDKLAVGPNTISANYSGNTLYEPAAATPITEKITAAATAVPVFSPRGGIYESVQTVSITSATADAVVYYTTDGSAPSTASTRYTKPISVTGSETIKAIAVAANHPESTTASASYTIIGSPAALASPATEITASSATLNAIVCNNGLRGTYSFHYGTSSAALTSSTAKTTLLASMIAMPVGAQLDGLKAKETYYYQVEITTAGGTAAGAVLSFTTK